MMSRDACDLGNSFASGQHTTNTDSDRVCAPCQAAQGRPSCSQTAVQLPGLQLCGSRMPKLASQAVPGCQPSLQ